METSHGLKVGDELAFNMGYYGWRIERVEKVTASGRVVAGCYTLNPDLTIRGRTSMTGPWRGEVISPVIREEYDRQQSIGFLKAAKWIDIDTESLIQIAKMAKDALTTKEPSEC